MLFDEKVILMRKYVLAFLITIFVILLLFGVNDFAGRSKTTLYGTVEENDGSQGGNIQKTDDQEMMVSEETAITEDKTESADVSGQSEPENTSKVYDHVTPFREFEEIEENYKILEYDICSHPHYDYEDTFLVEYYRDVIEETIDLMKATHTEEELIRGWGEDESKWFDMDYHMFDFNDDGLEDYMVCIYAPTWSGSGGNRVDILAQGEDGTYRRVLYIIMPTINLNQPDRHDAVAVLDEKTDGFYAIVTPFYNHILRYDKEEDRYVFHGGE